MTTDIENDIRQKIFDALKGKKLTREIVKEVVMDIVSHEVIAPTISDIKITNDDGNVHVEVFFQPPPVLLEIKL